MVKNNEAQARIDALRAAPISPKRLLIDGAWRNASTQRTLKVISPIDGAELTTIADASSDDVDAAVLSCRAAFERGDWSRSTPGERRRVLLRLADLIEAHRLELSVLGVRDNGTEIAMALKAEPDSAAETFRYYAGAVDKVFGEIAPSSRAILSLVHREPVGVVGAIVPWNTPLMIAAWKIAPSLAAGNSVVLKPAEGASLTLLRLGELALEAGLPKGVFNVITGHGPVAGEALARHMDVDVLAFTGSTKVGKQILAASAQTNLKRVYLELGGKSPNIVFADAPNLDAAVTGAVYGMFRNSGQVCVAASRLLLQRKIYDTFTEKLVAATAALKVGDPLSLSTDIGAISSVEQLSKNLECIATAISEGGDLLFGGRRILEKSGGFFMEPTIFAGIRPEMRIARDEVFGPLLSVMVFDDEEHAVRIANSTPYDLAAGIWTSNISTAHRMVRSVRAGLVHVNCYGGSDVTVPLGGAQRSGNGYDRSLHAFDKFTNRKTAWIQL